MPAPLVGAAAAVAARAVAKKLGTKAVKKTVTKVPKKVRTAAEARITQKTKAIKNAVKSTDVKKGSDIVIAKNNSGGSRPFSKGNYPPMGPKVPSKKK
jgi:hypothetical protein